MASVARRTSGRTIVVGDVHGCASELQDLLDHVAFTSGDRLVFVGDLVARGPDSLGVLDIVRATGAIVVRGNHEQKLIESFDASEQVGPGDTNKLHRDLARSLRPVDWSILRSTKVSLDLPEHDLRVVHAGIDPALTFAQQNPGTMMRIRTVSDPEKGQVLWGTVYVGPPHVVFGHNAAPGLQIHRWATGLDTGCVYGGRLTALVLGAAERIPSAPARRNAVLRSVPARRIWFEPTRAAC